MVGSDNIPITNFQFTVNFGGETTTFQEVILPKSEIEVIEYRDGSDVLSNVRKIPGCTKYTNLILKRGLIKSSELYDWFKQAKQGTLERRDITVNILNEEKEPFVTWKLRNCWPTKYSGSTLNAKGNEVVIETLEIATEDVDLEIK
ncbi:MAG: phage tail protein [Nitrosopumilus sp.]|nr:phage tail protein [Nitrosopumilus sp.]